MIERGCQELGINGGRTPKKIVIVGDSAGGNLTAAVTILSIQRGYRVPDGIILAYPGNISNFDNKLT